MAKKSTAITPVKAQDVTAYDPKMLEALNSAEGGLTDIGKDDVAIPFLTILQPLSPQCTQGDAAFIEGARPGDILQTVTKELHKSVNVVVADYRRTYIEWVPRNKGGGFRGEHGKEFESIFNSKLDRTTGRAALDNGNDLVDTRNFYVLTERDGVIEPAIISMASTQIKKAKVWVNMLLTYTPVGLARKSYPTWAARYNLSTVLEKNDKGSWFGWRISRIGFNDNAALMEEAQAFRAQILGGGVRVDRTVDAGIADTDL